MVPFACLRRHADVIGLCQRFSGNLVFLKTRLKRAAILKHGSLEKLHEAKHKSASTKIKNAADPIARQSVLHQLVLDKKIPGVTKDNISITATSSGLSIEVVADAQTFIAKGKGRGHDIRKLVDRIEVNLREVNLQRDKCKELIDAVKEHEKAIREAAHDPTQDGDASKPPAEPYCLLANVKALCGQTRVFSAVSAQAWFSGSYAVAQFEQRCPELKR